MQSQQSSPVHTIQGQSPLDRILIACVLAIAVLVGVWLLWALARNTAATSEGFLIIWGLFGLGVLALPFVVASVWRLFCGYRQFGQARMQLSSWPIPRGEAVIIHYQQPLKQPLIIHSVRATLICYEVVRRSVSDLTIDEAKAGALLTTRKQLLQVPLVREPLDEASQETQPEQLLQRSWRFTIPANAPATATINRKRYEWMVLITPHLPKQQHQPERFILLVV